MNSENPRRLILARHGNTFDAGETPRYVGARTDLRLTERGEQQAQALGAYLKGEDLTPALICFGPLLRQSHTATIVSAALNSGDKLSGPYAALSEFDYGLWENLTQAEIEERWPDEFKDWRECAAVPEQVFNDRWDQRRAGVAQFLAEIREQYDPGDCIVAISSNGLIRLFYSFLEEEWARIVRERSVESLKIKTGHLCELEIFDLSLRVSRWNINPEQ